MSLELAVVVIGGLLSMLTGVMVWVVNREASKIEMSLQGHERQFEDQAKVSREIRDLLTAETGRLRELIHSVAERVKVLEVRMDLPHRRREDNPGDPMPIRYNPGG